MLGYPSENAARMAVVGDNGRLTDPSLARPPVETCKHGHALSGENVMVRSDGKRDCCMPSPEGGRGAAALPAAQEGGGR